MNALQKQHNEVEAYVLGYLTISNFKKYDSAENRPLIVAKANELASGPSPLPPSPTLVRNAILALVDAGEIVRTDGLDEEDDARIAAANEEDRLRRQAEAIPLTESVFNRFVRMMPSEIEQKYHSDAAFRHLYDRAAKQWGFRIPKVNAVVSPSEDDGGSDLPRSAQEWHSIPARISSLRYQREPRFKAAVDKLIREGKI